MGMEGGTVRLAGLRVWGVCHGLGGARGPGGAGLWFEWLALPPLSLAGTEGL